MIVTVTMNPAIDKTATVDCLLPHQLNRLGVIEQDVGGKGINVSRTIAALGGSSVACGFLAGQSGCGVEQVLQRDYASRIQQDFLFIEGETRTNLKLVEPGGALTEINEQGPTATPQNLTDLATRLVNYAGAGTLFVLSGSVGPGVPSTYYQSLVAQLRAHGSRVFLDADGEQFANAIQSLPDIIKPNAFELSQYFGLAQEAGQEELEQMGLQLNARGIGMVCISMGHRGAIFASLGKIYRAPGLPVAARSSVGAGDAMVAAIAFGLDNCLPLVECLRLAMATSAAAVTTIGTKPPELQTVRSLQEIVRLEKE